MTNDELQKKISEIIDGSVDDWATRDRRGRIQVHVSTIADILVKAGLKFDASISHTATFDLLQQNRINELEKRIAEAEHRAARAGRALDKAVELAYEFRTEADTLSCSSCPMFHIFDSCKDRGLYQDCSKQWKEELIKQAEKELAEERKE